MLKLRRLEHILQGMGPALVAFSAGVDSSFLAAAARQALGKNAAAVTVLSPFVPSNLAERSASLARLIGINHFLLRQELPLRCLQNNPDRCYLCKKTIFSRIAAAAKKKGFRFVIEGSNVDDMIDFRPGARALQELGVASPLQTAGFSKDDIRRASRRMGLPTWNMESSPCLATRVPYGQKISRESLETIERAETYLRSLGARSVRVRCHARAARIEADRRDIPVMVKHRQGIVRRLKALGFAYVSLDLEGYRSGAMNEAA
ncbi:MAG TPA: ATP-dependent sacrificial sulfur transferase LarE [Candidatus Omnitrophota bacterium]|nr:ATP-dependent sacrificial sulfur transferase LarE [Candidatus Omnitrophota bacterium]